MGYGDINIWASILPVNLEDFYEIKNYPTTRIHKVNLYYKDRLYILGVRTKIQNKQYFNN